MKCNAAALAASMTLKSVFWERTHCISSEVLKVFKTNVLPRPLSLPHSHKLRLLPQDDFLAIVAPNSLLIWILPSPRSSPILLFRYPSVTATYMNDPSHDISHTVM